MRAGFAALFLLPGSSWSGYLHTVVVIVNSKSGPAQSDKIRLAAVFRGQPETTHELKLMNESRATHHCRVVLDRFSFDTENTEGRRIHPDSAAKQIRVLCAGRDVENPRLALRVPPAEIKVVVA